MKTFGREFEPISQRNWPYKVERYLGLWQKGDMYTRVRRKKMTSGPWGLK